MHVFEECRYLRRHGARHHAIERLEDRHVEAVLHGDRRHFQSDIAAADDRQARTFDECRS